MVLQPTTEVARTFDTTNTKLYLGYREIFFIKAGRQQLSKLAIYADFDNSFYIFAL
jgi:hypothetical protein